MKQGTRTQAEILRVFPGGLLIALVLAAGPAAAPAFVRLYPTHAQSRSLTPLQLEIEKQRTRLSSAEPEERRDAIMRLGALRKAEASRAALPALADPSPMVRVTAAAALSSLPADEAGNALVPLLNDKDEFVRQEVAYTLGNIHSRASVPALIERLALDKKDSVRGAAAVALGGIRDEAAVVPLAEILLPGSTARRGSRKRKPSGNEFVLRSAARSLGQIGSRAGAPALIATLTNDLLPGDIRREAAQALGLIGDQSAVAALRAAAFGSDPHLSLSAIEALNRIARKRQ